MPSYEIERVGDLEESVCAGYDIAMADDETLAAAVLTNSSYLKVVKYRLAAGGLMVNEGEHATSGQSAHASIAAVTRTHWVTSAQKIGGSALRLWQWNETSLQNDTEGEAASNPALAAFDTRFALIPPSSPLPPGGLSGSQQGYLVVTAHSTPQVQQLKVSAWFSGEHSIEDLASAVAPEKATRAAIVAYQVAPEQLASGASIDSATVITASITHGKLKLATWRVHVAARTTPSIELVAETSTEEEVSEVSAALFQRQLGDCLATAVVTKDGKLKLMTWKIRSDGTFTHWLDATAGEASGIDCVSVWQSDLAVGCRDGDGKLRVIYWRFPFANSDGTTVIRMGTAMAGTLGTPGEVRIAHAGATGRKPGDTIVACRTSAGKLKLIRFRLTPGA